MCFEQEEIEELREGLFIKIVHKLKAGYLVLKAVKPLLFRLTSSTSFLVSWGNISSSLVIFSSTSWSSSSARDETTFGDDFSMELLQQKDNKALKW